ncbi:MAG: hypothetical protein K9J06_10490 [Flavobacteriales bacterium]|nr:hypothetical protein [Flavobacteriales bacterium]
MRLPLLLSALALIGMACNTDHDQDCAPDRACTEEYRTVTIEVRDTSYAAYPLDSTFTVKASTGEEIRPQDYSIDSAFHIVLTDSQRDLTTQIGESFTFKGYRNGVLKVSEPFLIRHDCCHIIMVAGNPWVMVTD